jgi:hypothetical protein
LTSFGDAGIGTNFRLGYYRSGFAYWASVMAISNNTQVFLNGALITTLNAGQSYIFNNPAMGALLTTSVPAVANTGAHLDQPSGCGDGVYTQTVPTNVLGKRYYVVRTQGNTTAEQSTVIATQPNTTVVINTYNALGAFVSANTVVLPNAGSSHTFANGNGSAAFSANILEADKRVIVYVGSAQSCEVDQSVVGPIGSCSGSGYINTRRFTDYSGGALPYFGFVALESASEVVLVNGTNLETLAGARRQLGTSGLYGIFLFLSQCYNNVPQKCPCMSSTLIKGWEIYPGVGDIITYRTTWGIYYRCSHYI